MKHTITIALRLMLLLKCGQDPNSPITTTSDYFPLQIGNWWEYVVDTAATDGSQFISASSESVGIIIECDVSGKSTTWYGTSKTEVMKSTTYFFNKAPKAG